MIGPNHHPSLGSDEMLDYGGVNEEGESRTPLATGIFSSDVQGQTLGPDLKADLDEVDLDEAD